MALLINPRYNWSFPEDLNLTRTFGFPADVQETNDTVQVQAAIPGIRPEDIKIQIVGDTLTISGERKLENREDKGEYHQREIRYGNFSESIGLPAEVQAEKAEANFENGMLIVTLPKAEEAKPKNIEIKVAQK